MHRQKEKKKESKCTNLRDALQYLHKIFNSFWITFTYQGGGRGLKVGEFYLEEGEYKRGD